MTDTETLLLTAFLKEIGPHGAPPTGRERQLLKAAADTIDRLFADRGLEVSLR